MVSLLGRGIHGLGSNHWSSAKIGEARSRSPVADSIRVGASP
jgi:hypothetical protein